MQMTTITEMNEAVILWKNSESHSFHDLNVEYHKIKENKGKIEKMNTFLKNRITYQ